MVKKFIKNIIILLSANLLIKPVWILIIDRTVQNRVGPEEYGLYAALFNTAFVLNIIVDMGISYYNLRAYAKNEVAAAKAIPSVLFIKVTFSILYFILTFIYGWLCGFDNSAMKLLLMISLNQVLNAMILFFRSTIGGLQHFKTDTFFSIADRLLVIFICSYFLWFSPEQNDFSIEKFVFIQTISLFVISISGFIYTLYYSTISDWKIDFGLIKTIIRGSLPYALLIILQTFTFRQDMILLERLLDDGKVQAGIYAASSRLLETFTIFAYLFSVILLPLFTRMLAENSNLANLCKTASILLFIPSFTVSLVCFYYSSDILHLLYKHSEIYESTAILSLLMFSFTAISQQYVWGTLLTANYNLKHLNIISFIILIISVGGNLIFIPVYKSLAPAVLNVITHFLIVSCELILCIVIFKFSINLELIKKCLLFVFLSWLTVWGIYLVDISWTYRVILSIFFMMILSIVLNLISKEQITKIFQSIK